MAALRPLVCTTWRAAATISKRKFSNPPTCICAVHQPLLKSSLRAKSFTLLSPSESCHPSTHPEESAKMTSRGAKETLQDAKRRINDVLDLIPKEAEEKIHAKQLINDVLNSMLESFEGREEALGDDESQQKPYGCTFLNCNQTFDSKNDWKRHENSQHFHLEQWRCDHEKLGGICAKVCYRKMTFGDHLKEEHDISDLEFIENRIDSCRMGRNGQVRFWCGFCIKLVDLKKNGLEAWTERFDHIEDHFTGRRGFVKQSILDWTPVNSAKSQGEFESKRPLDTTLAIENHSDCDSNGCSSESTVEGDCYVGTKRKLLKDHGRSTKHAKTVTKAENIV